jgi:putative acetyltransferase
MSHIIDMTLHFAAGWGEDAAQIIALFKAAFTASEGPQEGQAIADLVAGMAALGPTAGLCPFAAWQGDRPIGALIFSPLRDPQGVARAMLLSPMAVAADRQGQGIGQALIAHALGALRAAGAQIAVTYGDPAFYGRTGFAPVTTAMLPAPHALSMPQGWIAQSLTDAPLPKIEGPLACVAPLDDPAFW